MKSSVKIADPRLYKHTLESYKLPNEVAVTRLVMQLQNFYASWSKSASREQIS